MSNIYRGSEWHKWDLHFHTPASFDCDYKGSDFNDLAVKKFISEEIKLVAITDHHTIDVDRIGDLVELSNDLVVFFPGVELRTNLGSPNIHIILIFSDSLDISILKHDFDTFKRSKGLPKGTFNDENLYFHLEDIADFAKEHDAIITVHAGSKTQGIDKEITNALAVGEATKSEYANLVHMFEVGKIKDIEDYEKIVFKEISKRPVIICSDNHDIRNYTTKTNLWVKGEYIFETLRQAFFHPDERIFVGDIPSYLDHANKNPSKYVDSIKIEKIEKSSPGNKWFDQEMHFNIALNTIIGNKGSGKSALSDIIGLSGNTKNAQYFSFLSSKMFRNPKPNYSVLYEAKLSGLNKSWENVVKLNDNIDKEKMELLNYLPQNYIEDICNSLDSKFQTEIDKAIFSYLEDDDKEYFENLQKYLNSKTNDIDNKISSKRDKISAINDTIVNLEMLLSPSYKKENEEKYQYYKNEISVHEKNKPIKVEKPKDITKEFEDNISPAISLIEKIKSKIEEKKTLSLTNKGKIEKINEFYRKYDSLKIIYDEMKQILLELSLDTSILEMKSDLTSIKAEKEKMEKTNEKLANEIQSFDKKYTMKNERQFSEIVNIIDEKENLNEKIAIINAYVEFHRENSSKPQKEYMNYLRDIQVWEEKMKSLIGNENTESFVRYKKIKEYLEEGLTEDIAKAYKERDYFFSSLFELLKEKIKLYNDIYEPIKEKLDYALSGIEIELKFSPENRFQIQFIEDILSRINKTIKSVFRPTEEGRKYINEISLSTDLSDFKSLSNLIDSLINPIKENISSNNTLVEDKKSFYDYLYKLDFLEQKYILKYNNKELTQLSPGERGLVLLIFYLALDRNDTPLVIDQPEDNLDNDSIYNILVKCIIKAKQHRQIIIVTHNPNIAIACDSELIINASINKKTNEIRYSTGSIEMKTMNTNMVNVLEGTKPAFELRGNKYIL